jgi:hypothetical protein
MSNFTDLVTAIGDARKLGGKSREAAVDMASTLLNAFTSHLSAPPGFLGFWHPQQVFRPAGGEAVAKYQQASESVHYDKDKKVWLMGFALLLTVKPFVALKFITSYKEILDGDDNIIGFSWSLFYKGSESLNYSDEDYETGAKNFANRVLKFFEEEFQHPDFWKNPPPTGGVFFE